MQDQIATAVGRRLVDSLQPGQHLAAAPTADIEAYALFLRANHRMRLRGAENLKQAIELFQRAIERDPNFARAYAGLAEAYALQPSYAGTSEKAAQPLVLAVAERAEALGERTAHVLGVRAFVHFRSREWQAAKNDFKTQSRPAPTTRICCSGIRSTLLKLARSSVRGLPQKLRLTSTRYHLLSISALVLSACGRTIRAGAESHLRRRLEYGSRGPDTGSIDRISPERRESPKRGEDDRNGEGPRSKHDWIDPVFAAMAKTGSTSAALDALHRDYASGKLGVSMYVGVLFSLATWMGSTKG